MRRGPGCEENILIASMLYWLSVVGEVTINSGVQHVHGRYTALVVGYNMVCFE